MAKYQPRDVVVEDGSVAWAVNRMVSGAVLAGRLSETEAALVYDLICHTKMPSRFLIAPKNGGAKREERF